MSDSEPNPREPSSDYKTMELYWQLVNSILGGAEAMRSVSSGDRALAYGSYSRPQVSNSYSQQADVAFQNLSPQAFAQLSGAQVGPQSPYLPKFPNETWLDYELRRRHAPFTNIYGDISRNLSSKPFSKECSLEDGVGDDLLKLSEDIDGQGNNFHKFSSETFKNGLDKVIDWILIDYTKVPPGATLADERTLGARPYWVHIPAERMIAVYSKFVNGKEVIHQARIHEPCKELYGFEEKTYERVRVFNREVYYNGLRLVSGFGPATWELWEEQEQAEKGPNGEKINKWVVIDSGTITIGIIPIVPFITGKRDGTSWKFCEMPMRDLAHMQVEEFQQESSLKSVKEMTAFPMLTGNGVTQPKGPTGESTVVPVGPKAVLFAPMGGDGRFGHWSWIQPDAGTLTYLETSLEKIQTNMRDLGMQPLTTSNLTVITTANVSQKAHSACQAWALALKDALEQAWVITCDWLKQKNYPTVKVHTDFSVEQNADADKDWLLTAADKAIISPQTAREEAKRRGVLSNDVTEEEEVQRLAEHQQGEVLQPEKMIDPVTGQPLVVQPKPGVPNPPPKPPVKPVRPTVN